MRPVFEIAAAIMANGEMYIKDYDAAVWTPKSATTLYVTVARPDWVRSEFYITFSKVQDLNLYQEHMNKLLVSQDLCRKRALEKVAAWAESQGSKVVAQVEAMKLK